MLETIGPPDSVTFWSKVDMTAGEDACWPWTGYKDRYGYGQTWCRPLPYRRAHRIAWVLTHGELPQPPEGYEYHGTVVRHECDNRACCNPRHLRIGTQADNIKDRDLRGRTHRRHPELDHAAVVAAREAGASYHVLGRQFGISHTTALKIVHRSRDKASGGR